MALRSRLALTMAALAIGFAVPSGAQQLTLGINAGVSTRDTVKAQTDKFAPLAQAAARALRITLAVEAVKSPDVPKEIASRRLDLLIIHTNAALAAAKKEGYVLLAMSQDLKDDRVYFMVSENGPATLADCKGKTLWTAGAKSYATDVGKAVLRANGVPDGEFNLKVTRYQDAIPFMLQNGFGEVGITRVASIASGWEKAGGRTLHATERLPVYALVARPGVDQALVRRLAEWMVQTSNSPVGASLLAAGGFKGFRAAAPEEVDSMARWFGL